MTAMRDVTSTEAGVSQSEVLTYHLQPAPKGRFLKAVCPWQFELNWNIVLEGVKIAIRMLLSGNQCELILRLAEIREIVCSNVHGVFILQLHRITHAHIIELDLSRRVR